MDVTIEKLDYVILNSGYTARIITKFLENGIILHPGQETVYKLNPLLLQEDYDPDLHGDKCDLNIFGDIEYEDIDLFLKSIIFIYDNFWGEGLYKFSPLQSWTKGVNTTNILKLVNEESLRGCICLECNDFMDAMHNINILASINYCAMLSSNVCGLTRMRYINKKGIKILIVSLDAESG